MYTLVRMDVDGCAAAPGTEYARSQNAESGAPSLQQLAASLTDMRSFISDGMVQRGHARDANARDWARRAVRAARQEHRVRVGDLDGHDDLRATLEGPRAADKARRKLPPLGQLRVDACGPRPREDRHGRAEPGDAATGLPKVLAGDGGRVGRKVEKEVCRVWIVQLREVPERLWASGC